MSKSEDRFLEISRLALREDIEVVVAYTKESSFDKKLRNVRAGDTKIGENDKERVPLLSGEPIRESVQKRISGGKRVIYYSKEEDSILYTTPKGDSYEITKIEFFSSDKYPNSDIEHPYVNQHFEPVESIRVYN